MGELNHTGVYITENELETVRKLMQGMVKVNLETNITIAEPPNQQRAFEMLNAIAKREGLPALPEGNHYGLTSERELVSV